MRCDRCGTELIAGKRFCHACGAAAALQCPSCGAPVGADFRFCPDCGRAIALCDATPSPADGRVVRHIPEALARKIRAAQGTMEGERKQVTVLFCDLAGSTAIAERLDPEEYAEVLDEYVGLAFAEIYRLEGFVNMLAGDGLMALFGAPVAHEDAPQRAVRAALAIRDALGALNERLLPRRAVELMTRIGIHTGPVVVGTVGNDLKMDYTAVGDTTNLAARLEALATPGTILVSDATYRLVRGLFDVTRKGPFTVKGKSEPVIGYEVTGETSGASPMTIAAERGLTPLVGREAELAQLAACFDRLENGLAQVVAVVGEAGLGKSRLVYEFTRRLEGRRVTFFEGRSSSLGQSVPYTPFLGLLKHYFGLVPGESVEQACARVDARLGARAEEAEQAFPALGRLLGLRLDTDVTASPEDLKRETFEAVTGLLLKESRTAPVVVTLEDLHWIDEPSRELLDTLLARLADARIMVLLTHRPDDRTTWRTRAALTQLVLGRLSDEAVRSIAQAVAGGPLPEAVEALVAAKAEGSPFCAEEFTRALVEEGSLVPNGGVPRLTRPVEEIRIPGTVQEVIAARLDRLGPQGKRVVQVAAVLGRQFHRRELERLLDGDVTDLDRELADLERRGIFHRKSLLVSDEYRFGESVTQEVAYEGLLLKQRRQLHDRVAQALEASPAPGPERAALLAHHYERSDSRAKAVAALLQAGRQTEQLPSYRPAAEFYRRAWELAEAELAAGGDAAIERLALEAASGVGRLTALFGAMNLADAEPAIRRGRELAERLGDTETLVAQCYFHGVIVMQSDPNDFAAGLALAEEGMTIAERAGLKLAAMRLSRGLGMAYVNDGRFDLARRVIGWSADEMARRNEPPLSDLALSTRWIVGLLHYLCDEFDPAMASLPETYELARRAPNRTVTSGSAGTLAQLHFLRAEYAEARRWAEESLAIAEEIANVAAFPGAAAVALAARHELGEANGDARYLGLIEQGMVVGGSVQVYVRFLSDALRGVHDRAVLAHYADLLHRCPPGGRLREATSLSSLAELWLHLGRYDDADRALARAIAVAESIGARSVLAAATVGAAELAAARGDRPTMTRYLDRAVTLARDLDLRHYLARAAALLEETSRVAADRA